MAPEYTHPDFARWERELSTARNEANGKPLQNNTRLFRRGEDAIAIRLHSTDVVTFHRDGTRRLASGGWYTVTTRDRIRDFGSRYVHGKVDTSRSESDGWFVKAEEDPRDPHPLSLTNYRFQRAERSVPKPYSVPNPGPEPVDDGVGCIAGRTEEYIAQDYVRVYDWGDAPKSSEYVTNRFYPDGSGPCPFIHRATVETILYGEQPYQYSGVPAGATYKQCPHCKAFQARHEHWRTGMFGNRWGRGCGLGYEKMCEMLDTFETREGWQDAYLEDLRTVRELNARVRVWEARNFVPFYDGIEVTPEGLAPLKAKRAHCRKLEEAERERRRQERVHKRVRREQERLERKFAAQRKRERAVRRQVAEALAHSLVGEMEAKRGEYPNWKRGEL